MVMFLLLPVSQVIAQADGTETDSAKQEIRYDPWLGFDKVQHFTVSCLWTLSTQYLLETKLDYSSSQALPLSLGSALLAGIGKEVYDRSKEKGFFSRRDLVADMLGIALGVFLIQL